MKSETQRAHLERLQRRRQSIARANVRVDGDVAYVTLTKGYVAVIDAIDAESVGRYRWSASVRDHTVYARRTFEDADGRGHSVMLHRVILGVQDGELVDHKDGDGLNNRRANLRPATPAQNMHNKRLAKNNTSGITGVTWVASAGKWQAQVRHLGKNHCIGRFQSKEEAAEARRQAAIRIHGSHSSALLEAAP